MKIAIFGASGIVGRAITHEALARGYEVTVLTRDASHIKEKSPCLRIVTGDVMDAATTLNVVRGQDAVIQTLGIGGKGDPAYYSRFGYETTRPAGIRAPFEVDDKYFMYCKLDADADVHAGVVRYSEAFGL